MLAEVHAPVERERAVDHRELLGVRAERAGAGVEGEADAIVGAPLEGEALHPLALERVDDAEVPGEHVDLELGPSRAELVQEGEQAHRVAPALRRVRGLAAEERHVAVELPAGQEHVALRAHAGFEQRGVVRLAVDEHGGAVAPPRAKGARDVGHPRQGIVPRRTACPAMARASRGRGTT